MRSHAVVFMVCAAILLSFPHESSAQWVQTIGPGRGPVSALAVVGTNLFARTADGTFISTDQGASWTSVSSRLPGLKWIAGYAEIGPNLFAATDQGIVRSRDNGANWEKPNPGLPVKTQLRHLVLAACGETLFAATYLRVYQSDNYGAGWEEVKIGLTEGVGFETIEDLAVVGADLYALVGNEGSGRVYVSTKDGVRWKAFKVFPTRIGAHSLAVSGQRLLAGGEGSIYTISNNGGRAKIVPHKLPEGAWVACLAVSGTTIFAGTNNGIFCSTDNCESWEAIKPGLADTHIQSLAVSGTYLFAGTGHSGVWRLPLADLFPEKH